MTARWVLHADLDAFFASAEVLRRPELRGKPVLVGGSPEGRGVVASASYEARAMGVRSAMPMARALVRCPGATVLRGDFPYYKQLSRHFRELLEGLSPEVEMASIDEAYLDLTGTERSGAAPVAAGRALQARLGTELGLSAAIGLAPNKTVAKIASESGKPGGNVVVHHAEVAEFLAPLPADRLPGVGPEAFARLVRIGLRTVGDIATAPAVLLRDVFGKRGAELALLARGIDDRPVTSKRRTISVSHEETFAADVADLDELRRVLDRYAERIAAQLRQRGLGGRVVAVKLRDADFHTVTRQRALPTMTDLARPFRDAGAELLTEALSACGWRRIRLVGLRVSGLAPLARQLELFDTTEPRDARLSSALDEVRARFGARAIEHGVQVRAARRRA